MPSYTYTASSRNGALQTGQLVAESRQQALTSLREQAMIPIALTEAAGRSALALPTRISSAALSGFFNGLADLLDSGVPLLKSIEILGEQTGSHSLKTILRQIRGDVADGRTLAQSLSSFPRIFNSMMINMIRAGEEAGFLEDSLRRIASFAQRSEELRGKVLSALAYPTFLLLTGFLVMIGMLTFFVPKFEPMFARLREQGRLPAVTTLLLNVSGIFREHAALISLVILVSLVALRSVWSNPSFERWRHGFVMKLPIFGAIAQSLAIGRFSRVLGTLLQNQVSLLRSLSIAREACGNLVLRDAIAAATDNISSGKTLAQPLRESGVFPREILEMVSVAEQANRLDTILTKLADNLEEKAHRTIDVLMKLLEPILMLVMALFVGFLVMALLLPIFEGTSST